MNNLFTIHTLTPYSNRIQFGTAKNLNINSNFLQYQIDTHITDRVNSILSLGCISLINKPTRFSSTHQPSLLDHIYTNIIDDNTTTGIVLYDVSDHLPIFANFNFHPKCAKNTDQKVAVKF